MLSMCRSTVRTLKTSRSAIWALVQPSATRLRIWDSRVLSCEDLLQPPVPAMNATIRSASAIASPT
jgi:hypothetical protein